MKIKSLITAAALLAAMSPAIAANGLTDSQKKDMEQVVHDYLVKNPEVLIEASQALQQKQQDSMQKQANAAILKNADNLFNESTTILGNPKGNVTVVEFFDNQCIHCKKMAPILANLLKKDGNLRVIYKEFPIFGKTSDLASKAALAAAMQGKYEAMHEALLKQDKQLTEASIDEIAKSVGLDMDKLKTDMQSKKVQEILDANKKLAEEMHLMGTPAFIVGYTPGGKFKQDSKPAFVPGAASEQSLMDLIKKAHENKES
jgi:protein-disulfide isomerase